ncbi:tRNA pseudouridine synthase A [Corynebacterium deserti GIMN1.010]|uniref:tRNA pseudouridine synthase A n=1 Tax=Corynebacterium deserti GIMN1.010 TaxID=931089 RepID=A0A0M3Q954_9CORY|nr:tRNA pseudouridine(38-40) synthase TruA [Corynebacterium deserti]ALC05043.1 tRNA pseudouridine synthase A [Corynebacterium deserti GIMN1.010]
MSNGDTVRIRLDLAYDGTDFHGWAKQGTSDLRTVQKVLEENLSMVLRENIELTVAGRTDAGVHAAGQVAHFDVVASALEQRSIDGDPARLVRRLARLLPDDIRVHDVSVAPAGFDARFSALRRHYVYRITTHPAGPVPTRNRDTASWPKPVEIERMQLAADALLGLHDFVAFCKAKPNATTVRELQEFSWRDVSTPTEPQLYEAHVVADAFCWSMVRSLVGSCMAVGEGRRAQSFTEQLLHERERSPMVPVAPAKGLSLVGVDYPDADKLLERAEETRAMREIPNETASRGLNKT